MGDTTRSAELRHVVPRAIGDPFVYAEVGGRRVVAIGGFEMELVREVVPAEVEVQPLEHFGWMEISRSGIDLYAIWPELCARVARDLGVSSAVVPSAFPTAVADRLRTDGVALVVDQRFFDDRRRAKRQDEVAHIRGTASAATAALAAVRGALGRSLPGEEGRMLDGEPLTCERLKALATGIFGDHGVRGDDLILAHGPQTADGHDQGSGQIANDDVVLCDFFPRHITSGYYADVTRTFQVGSGGFPELAAWHAECCEALELARAMTRPGVDGKDVHRAVSDFFRDRGHPVRLDSPDGDVLLDGFFHATGHGVGLDVHEAPNLGRTGHLLVAGDVVAIEPGLYRHGVGGVRVEDLVLVTDSGCENLTPSPYGL